MLRSYQREWLRADIVAGFVLAALLLPQGMAYAQLAGMPPVTGIYATMVPMVVYALVGPSRILVVGPDSAVGPLVAAALLSMASNPAQSAELGSLLALLVGGCLRCRWVGRERGFLTELLSKPVRVGYMNGLALIIRDSQIPKLLGFSTHQHTLRGELRATIDGIDRASLTSLAIGVAALTVILAIRHVRPKLPGILAAVVLSTLVVSLLDLSVPVVGQLPSGLPTPSVPGAGGADLTDLLAAAIGIAFVAFADTGSLSRSYATRIHQDVDQNQELIALGVVNASAGLFQGFPISTSASRTAVAEAAGSRTQAAGLVAAALMGVVLCRGERDRPKHARIGIGGGRHRRRAFAVRPWRCRTARSHPANGVRAVPGLLRRRRPVRRAHRNLRRHRAVAAGLRATRVAPPRRRPGTGRGHQGVSRHDPASGGTPNTGADHLPVRLAVVLRQRRPFPRPHQQPRRKRRPARLGG